MAQPCDMDLWVMKWRSAWPIFHVQWIWILKTIWCMNIIVRDNESVWYDIWPKINVGHCDLYFMVQWFCLISWRLFDVWTSLFGSMSRYEPKVDLKVNIGHCDLHFMVQWFCVTSWRLFDICKSYFGIMGQYDPTFDLKINVSLCDLYVVVQWFCHISKTIWYMSAIFSDNETVWPKLWPQNKCKSTWRIFHGLLILLNNCKIIWLMV